MSHVASVDIELTDLDAVEAACKRLGWTLKRDQKTYKWYGKWVKDYHGADAAYKNGFDPKDFGKCDHAISIPGVNYEIGLVHKGKHFAAIFDFWDGALKKAVGGQGCDKLKQMYAVEKMIRVAKKKGYKIKEKKLDDGKIKLTVTAERW